MTESWIKPLPDALNRPSTQHWPASIAGKRHLKHIASLSGKIARPYRASFFLARKPSLLTTGTASPSLPALATRPIDRDLPFLVELSVRTSICDSSFSTGIVPTGVSNALPFCFAPRRLIAFSGGNVGFSSAPSTPSVFFVGGSFGSHDELPSPTPIRPFFRLVTAVTFFAVTRGALAVTPFFLTSGSPPSVLTRIVSTSVRTGRDRNSPACSSVSGSPPVVMSLSGSAKCSCAVPSPR